MENNGTTVAMPESIAPREKCSKKKITIKIVAGVLVLGLIVGAFFVGKSCSKNHGEDTGNEDLASQLEFAEADLESTRRQLEEARAELAEATGQEAPVERSLEEQLNNALREAGAHTERVLRVGEIQNSPIAPFQWVSAITYEGQIGEIASTFWRNGASGQWHYYSTHGPGGLANWCSSYTGASWQAFAGQECWDMTSQERGIIGEHYLRERGLL